MVVSMIRFSRTIWAALAALLLAPPALAGSFSVEKTEYEFSTSDLTCADDTACQAPSVSGRAEVGGAGADASPPDDACAKDILRDRETADPSCVAPQPNVQPGVVHVYVDVDGFEPAAASASPDDLGSSTGTVDSSLVGSDLQSVLMVSALGLGASGAVALFGLRRFLVLLLAPLATRLNPSELLDDETRRRIYQEVRTDPGVNLRTIAARLDLAWGTLLHHLHKLEKAHLVVSRRYGKYRRYFINGSTYTREEQAKLAALSTPSTARVAGYILDHPGSTQAQIGGALGVTPSTVLWHARRLADVQLIDSQRDGRFVKYYPHVDAPATTTIAVA